MDLNILPCCSFYVEEDEALNLAQEITKSTMAIETDPQCANGRSCPCCTGLAEKYRREQNLSVSSQDEEMPVMKVLAEGWLQKKGSGRDWLGTTTWKDRWAKLASTSVPGYDVHVPVLHLHWHPSFRAPSTSIVLDGTVVMVNEENGPCSFDIVYVNGKEDHGPTASLAMMNLGANDNASTRSNVRTFAALQVQDRDQWITQINRALREYERRKNASRVLNARPKEIDGSLLPRSPLSPCTMMALKRRSGRAYTCLPRTPGRN